MPKFTRRAVARRCRAARGRARARQARLRRRRGGRARTLQEHVHNHAPGSRGDDRRPGAGRRRPATTSTRSSTRRSRCRYEPGPRARVHAARDRPGDRDRARRLLPRLDVQRHRAGAGDPRDRGRHAAGPASSTHGSHPHTIHFHGIHPANMDGVFEVVQLGRGVHLRVRGEARRACTSTTATRRR